MKSIASRWILALALVALLLGPATRSWAQVGHQTYAASRFVLVLDGNEVGDLKNAMGGEATTAPGGGVVYSEMTLMFGTGMSKPLRDWIAQGIAGSPSFKSGAVLMVDAGGHVQSRLAFANGAITEVTLPALDGASKDAGYFTMQIAPQTTTFSIGSTAGTQVQSSLASKQKAWLCSNFKIEIPGISLTRVNHIDPITFTFPLPP